MATITYPLQGSLKARIEPAEGFLDPPQFLDTLVIEGDSDEPPSRATIRAADKLWAAFRELLLQREIPVGATIEVRTGACDQIEWRWREPGGVWTPLWLRPSPRLIVLKALQSAIRQLDVELGATSGLTDDECDEAVCCALRAADDFVWSPGRDEATWQCLAALVVDLLPLSPLQRIGAPKRQGGRVRRLPVRLSSKGLWQLAASAPSLARLGREQPQLLPLVIIGLHEELRDVSAGGLRRAFRACGGSRAEWRLLCHWDESSGLRSLAAHGLFVSLDTLAELVRLLRTVNAAGCAETWFSAARAKALFAIAKVTDAAFPMVLEEACRRVASAPSAALQRIPDEVAVIEARATACRSSRFLVRAASWDAAVEEARSWRARRSVAGWSAPFGRMRMGSLSARAVTDPLDLEREGSEMAHCVASFAPECRRGAYAVYRLEESVGAGSRATLGLRWSRSRSRWVIDQVCGYEGTPVSPTLRSFAR